MCYDKYKAQGKIDESASLRCYSKIYENMETFASVSLSVKEKRMKALLCAEMKIDKKN